MGRSGKAADHENRVLIEPEDETARIFYAAEDGEVVATSRFSWGGDAAFSERLVEGYQLAPFLAELPPETMAVGERGMVVTRLRGSPIFQELGRFSSRFVTENRIQLIFGACEPHLLSLYLGQGCRTFAKRNINSADAGYFIPIVTVVEDVEYLRRIGSPSAETAVDFGADARIPACVERLVDSSSVMSQRLTSSRAYWGEVHSTLGKFAENRLSALDGLSEDEAERALGKSNIIRCRAGDRVLKKGGVARNMFVVLAGTLEAREGDEVLRVLSAGDVFGEMAFLLEQPRAADVFAATDARILSLSESTLRQTIASDPTVAANLLLNVSKMLCYRILESR
jgi:CRP-like cAMP-binding protein